MAPRGGALHTTGKINKLGVQFRRLKAGNGKPRTGLVDGELAGSQGRGMVINAGRRCGVPEVVEVAAHEQHVESLQTAVVVAVIGSPAFELAIALGSPSGIA